ncbi:hypothetical protein [Acinetobacter sp. ULE_I068]|uniref:hypothetical protein n=1 Tax=Acinetobacter sp. ULE_I068 TaxID=3373072 RepID=UPI003AF74CCA
MPLSNMIAVDLHSLLNVPVLADHIHLFILQVWKGQLNFWLLEYEPSMMIVIFMVD